MYVPNGHPRLGAAASPRQADLASEARMEKYLGLKPGSVSPFGLINDTENHVHLFLDKNLQNAPRLSFHPNDNTATIVIRNEDFIKYLEASGNEYEFVELYE